MSKPTPCAKLAKAGLFSVVLLWMGWLLQLAGGEGAALVPSWVSWSIGFMLLLPAGLIGLTVTAARAFRMKACMPG